MTIAISHPDDSRIEAYRAIRERDLIGRENRFIVEGEVVLRVLARQRRFPIESVLLSENRTDPLRDITDRLPPHVPVYSANRGRDGRDRRISHPSGHARGRPPAGRPHRRGMSAMPFRPARWYWGSSVLPTTTMSAASFATRRRSGRTRCSSTTTCCDPLYRKAIRVSVGGVLVVPFARCPSADAMVTELEAAGFDVMALSPSGRGKARCRKARAADRAASRRRRPGPSGRHPRPHAHPLDPHERRLRQSQRGDHKRYRPSPALPRLKTARPRRFVKGQALASRRRPTSVLTTTTGRTTL